MMSFWKFFLCARLDAIEQSLLHLKETATVTPEVQAAFDALKGSVQGLDDLNPDAPVADPAADPAAAAP